MNMIDVFLFANHCPKREREYIISTEKIKEGGNVKGFSCQN